MREFMKAAWTGTVAPAVNAGLERRGFLKYLGLGASTLAFCPWSSVMAGPFTRADFDKLVPADKKLSKEWLESLTARGNREVYRGAALEKIGMPIGGICAGQLYLGGDGKLWHWDIFNRHIATGADHYARPMSPGSPVDQGFTVRIQSGGRRMERALDRHHWRDISFIGEYPIGYVDYRDADSPVSVSLEAFSPFIPLNADDSSLPATVLHFTVKNTSTAEVEGEIVGWLENACCLYSGKTRDGFRRNHLARREGALVLECSAMGLPPTTPSGRADILFEDFEAETYDNWTVSGTAFGTGPIEISKIPGYQGDVGGKGKRVVNSHASAPGNSVTEKDNAVGTLRSRTFTIERDYIRFLIGGGAHPGQTCINLMLDDKVVLSATGANNNRMQPMSWDVRHWAGKTAGLQIVDEEPGDWGNIGIDHIVFSDRPHEAPGPLASEEDFGTLALALLSQSGSNQRKEAHTSKSSQGLTSAATDDFGCAALPGDGAPSGDFSTPTTASETAQRPFAQKLAGSVGRKFKLAPGATATATFSVAWHFPNLRLNALPPGRYYASRFDSASAVVDYLAKNLLRLSAETRRWHDTWYNSTLPYWFLDRTFLNTSILATSTSFRLGNGRFYAWEGVGCCEGTCGHVWQYAHAMARLFPDLERDVREKVDFGLALQPDGAIHFRGEFNNFPAIDAQAGTILRALREHQMTTSDAWLKRNWPAIKKATEFLILKDGNADGLITSNQHNTLDTDWYGPVAWLSGLYLASLLAAAEMADVAGDPGFAAQCQRIAEVGRKNLVADLFDGEYFANKVDPKHLDAINSGTGCHIDQVMGQSWAFQVGLPRLLPRQETTSALKSLWRYNFTPDVGPYRAAYKAGRWYAMAGEAGLLMCTFPRSDWDYLQAKGKGAEWAAGYFNECMNGFEYQVAGHMIWEGLLTEGLAITRAVHDRYHPSRRNPFNEVECGDHYARSMASYGVFLAACGYEYNGPKGHLGFAPRLTPQNFRCPFTTAEGWGQFSQQTKGGKQKAEIEVKFGKLWVQTLALGVVGKREPVNVTVSMAGKKIPATLTVKNGKANIKFDAVFVKTDEKLQVELV